MNETESPELSEEAEWVVKACLADRSEWRAMKKCFAPTEVRFIHKIRSDPQGLALIRADPRQAQAAYIEAFSRDD